MYRDSTIWKIIICTVTNVHNFRNYKNKSLDRNVKFSCSSYLMTKAFTDVQKWIIFVIIFIVHKQVRNESVE